MNESIFEKRNEKFKNSNIIENKEKLKIQIRKSLIEKYLSSKRVKLNNKNFDFEVKIEELNISPKILEDISATLDEYLIKSLKYLNSNDIEEVKYGCHLVRILLIEKDETILDQFFKYKIYEKQIELFVTSKDFKIIFEIAWSLVNITYHIPTRFQLLTPVFMNKYYELLNSGIEEIEDLIIWLLSNIIGDENFDDGKSLLVNSNIFQVIRKWLDDDNTSMNRIDILTYFLRNLINYYLEIPEDLLIYLTDTTLKYIVYDSFNIFLSCMAIMCNIAKSKVNIIKLKIKNSGIFERIVKLNIIVNTELKIFILRFLINYYHLYENLNEDFEYLFQVGIFHMIESYFNDENIHVKFKSSEFIEIFLSQENIKTLLFETRIYDFIFKNTKTKGLSEKFISVIVQTCKISNFDISSDMVTLGIFDLMTHYFEMDRSPTIIALLLSALKYILKSGEEIAKVNNQNPFLKKFEEIGGFKKVENFQKHKNNTIFAAAAEIIDTYFTQIEY